MTDTLVIEAAKQVPALAVLVYVVMKFLQHIQASEATRNESLKALGDTCHEFQAQMMARFEASSKEVHDAITEDTRALGRAGGIAERMERIASNIEGSRK